MPKLIAMLIIVCLGISTILIITKFQSGNETRSNPGWQVEIEQGFLEESSRLYSSRLGREIHSFLGVPYGVANRLRKPDPALPWKGVYHANNPVQCIQSNVLPYPSVVGQEDCLSLNIYTTSKHGSGLPVIVWIHGGGFTSGSGSPGLYGPHYFMDHDIVFVAINYRLGALGFMGMNDDVMPGNLGLWDQKLALEWVQSNIHAFGGDSKKVTLAGQSAGGMSAFLHQLSPQSKGLFRATIIQSGITTVPFVKSDKHPAYYTRTLAKAVGCFPDVPSHTLLTCLHMVDPEKLYLTGLELFTTFGYIPNPFKPSLDNGTSVPFLPKEPWELMTSGEFSHVPSIQGYNELDGAMFTSLYARDPTLFKETKDNFEGMASLMMYQREPDEITQNDRTVAQYYFEKFFSNGKLIPESLSDDLTPLTRFFTHIYAVAGATGVKMMADQNSQPVYGYTYAHRGTLSTGDLFAYKLPQLICKYIGELFGQTWYRFGEGASHGDELFLMFVATDVPFVSIGNERDQKTSELVVTAWANFAKHLDPTPNEGEFGVRWPRLAKKKLGNSLVPHQAYIRDGKLVIRETTDINGWIEEYHRISKVPHHLHHYQSTTWSNPKLHRDKILNRGRKKAVDEL